MTAATLDPRQHTLPFADPGITATETRAYRTALELALGAQGGDGSLGRILWILLDGEWHSTPELRERVAPSADSRVRDLRKKKFGGFTVDRARATAIHRPGGAATFYYRLLAVEPRQVSAFLERARVRRVLRIDDRSPGVE